MDGGSQTATDDHNHRRVGSERQLQTRSLQPAPIGPGAEALPLALAVPRNVVETVAPTPGLFGILRTPYSSILLAARDLPDLPLPP